LLEAASADKQDETPLGEDVMRARHIVTSTLCLALTAVPVMAQQAVAAGRIKVAAGEVFVVRAGVSTHAHIGQDVFEADHVRTGADGEAGITLKDDTRVSVGPMSDVQLDEFVYSPSEGRLALALRFLQGVAVYVSGRIAQLSPDAVRLETPAAIVGVRGTTVAIKVGAE
jgi:hypothetical protein